MHDKSVSAAVSEKIRRCIAEHKMLEGCSGILVGFSGGADSTALLHWLCGYCAEHSIRLVALHVNHGIRGDEAKRDEEFCRTFCESRKIEYICITADVPALVKSSGRSIEEEARDVRYKAFEQTAAELGLDRIATAHNADDNLETVIFNLVRGTGAAGMAGIPPVRGKIVRPLLYCEKSELIEYCLENKLAFTFDSTNDDTEYTRNYIRHEIVPRLKNVNPAASRNALRMCRALREDGKTLSDLAGQYSLADGRERLARLDSSLLSRVISREFESFSGGLTLEAAHIDASAEHIKSARAYFTLSLPGRIRLVCDRDNLFFEPDPRRREEQPEHFSVTLLPGVNRLPCGMMLVSHGDLYEKTADNASEMAEYIKEYKNIYKFFIQAYLRSDRINGVLSAQAPRGSAKMRVRGMSRTVKNLLAEKKLSKAERSRIVMVCDGDGPLWIPGVAVRDGNSAAGSSKDTLLLVYFFN